MEAKLKANAKYQEVQKRPELSKRDKIEMISYGIIATYGKATFNIGETAKIIDKDRKFVGPAFDERGILAIRQGNMKYFTAVAIAEYLYSVQISPLQMCRKSKQAVVQASK